MKFGRNLLQHQLPIWDQYYIDYKSLKKLIKNILHYARKDGLELYSEAKEIEVREEFWQLLHNNLIKVDEFYSRQIKETLNRHFRHGNERHENNLIHPEQSLGSNGFESTRHDLSQKGASNLLLIDHELQELQEFGRLNHQGFIKIVKKYCKKIQFDTILKESSNPEVFRQDLYTRDFTAQFLLGNILTQVRSELRNKTQTSCMTSASGCGPPTAIVSASANELKPSNDQDIRWIAVENDDISGTKSSSAKHHDLSSPRDGLFETFLLEHAVLHCSRRCILKFLEDDHIIEQSRDSESNNLVHRLIKRDLTSLSYAQARNDHPESWETTDQRSTLPTTSPEITNLMKNDRLITGICFLIAHCNARQIEAILTANLDGRTVLHETALYDLSEICRTLLCALSKNIDRFGEDYTPFMGLDKNRRSALHDAVQGRSASCVELLLEFQNQATVLLRDQLTDSGDLVYLAVRMNAPAILSKLLRAGADGMYQDATGETALHRACRSGYQECVSILLESSDDVHTSADICEHTFQWTPLHTAAVHGNPKNVQLLLIAGADHSLVDVHGWTSLEHAAFRGHLAAARLIAERSRQTPKSRPDGSEGKGMENRAPDPASFQPNRIWTNSNIRSSSKEYGYECLQQESRFLVSLGSLDNRRPSKVVNLENNFNVNKTVPAFGSYSLRVSSVNAAGEAMLVDLPIHDSISTEPASFSAEDVTNVKLVFDLIPTQSAQPSKTPLARGVADLSCIRQAVGSMRVALHSEMTISLLSCGDAEVVGSVTFSYLVITPFLHPKSATFEKKAYWRQMDSTMVIGHRGLGMNTSDRSSLQLGENTIQSFIAASNLGAEYVEFDVQLTKDHVPVIYHDFLVSETGIDAPVYALTLDQFVHLNEARPEKLGNDRPTSRAEVGDKSMFTTFDIRSKANGSASKSGQTFRGRASSLDSLSSSGLELSNMSERMKHTRDFKIKGFKGNTRGTFIQAPFATLQEMFVSLPEHIGFNIEMKYPMLFEAEEHGMDPLAIEPNHFVETVLRMVYDLAGKRHVMFSSFNPDICILLKSKQPHFPVLFLTDAGTCPVGDIRASSLQEAIRFASRWNLLGIVSAAEPFILAPRLVQVVKKSGLVCISYGKANNDPELVKLQVRQGIDAVIVDKVLAIRNGLTEKQST